MGHILRSEGMQPDPDKVKAVMKIPRSSNVIQNSKVNNVENAIIIQKAITKSSVGQHGPPTNAKVGSGVAVE
jgi:hypothetical protein